MKIVLLDGSSITDPVALHAAFARALDLPDWYGANLDALHDVLTERREETGVIAVNTGLLAEHLGRRWHSLLRLLADVKDENPHFHYVIDPFAADGQR